MKFSNPTKITKSILAITASCLLVGTAFAEPTRVTVRIENVAPDAATFQTPVWVGLHDGVTFDTYNGGQPAGLLPNPGSVNQFGQGAMEAICEDGATAQIAADFAQLQPLGQDMTVPGPNGPIAPGEIAEFTFTVDSVDPNTRYFSYASMILPSNDFCISNALPDRHPIFDAEGNFVAESFFVVGNETLDAGTEVNDEIPANTAFFGQAARDTGVDQNGVIARIGTNGTPNVGFLAPNPNDPAITILEDPLFAESTFLQTGYSLLKFTFAQEPAADIVEELEFRSVLRGRNEVPSVRTRTFGAASAALLEQGTVLEVLASIVRLPSDVEITLAHLHLGAEGENGPVIANLLAENPVDDSTSIRRINASLESSDLLGPLSGQTLSDLVRAIQEERVYVNIHTDRNPAGEVRGQLIQQ